jgi:predicted PurR-regulated permease PerM
MEIRRNRMENRTAAITRLIVWLLLAAAAGYVLYRVGFIIVVVLISVMLALTVAPLVDWLQATRAMRLLPRPVRRGTSAVLVFLALGAGVVTLAVMIIQPLFAEIRQFATNWPRVQAELAEQVRWFQERYAALPTETRVWIEEHGARDVGARLAEQAQQTVQRLAASTAHSGMLLVELILIPVLAFSFLTESRPLKREFTMLLPRAYVKDGLYVLRQTGSILQSYAIGQLILALIAGVVVWFLLVGMGIRYPLALAVIAAVTRVIPVIGPIIGGIPIVLLATLQGWDKGLIVLVAFSLMHLIESKVVMPRIIGYRIKLHPAIVIIVLLIGAEFWGMWGMFLAAPVAAVGKVLLHHFFVRPRLPRPVRRGPGNPPAAEAPVSEKGPEVERPAVAGVRGHTGAH